MPDVSVHGGHDDTEFIGDFLCAIPFGQKRQNLFFNFPIHLIFEPIPILGRFIPFQKPGGEWSRPSFRTKGIMMKAGKERHGCVATDEHKQNFFPPNKPIPLEWTKEAQSTAWDFDLNHG